MPRDKAAYVAKVSKAGNRPETKNQEVLVEVLVDILDVLDDCLTKLGDIETVLQEQ